jgi:hypothetical protein
MKKLRGVQLPEGITFDERDPGNLLMHINHPQKNMQADDAAFESWALLLRSKGIKRIQLSFRIEERWHPKYGLKYQKRSSDKNHYKTEKQHFMRFLFRVWKFQESMKWFYIKSGECAAAVDQFIAQFQNGQMTNNVPNCHANLKESKGTEHILENIFVRVDDAKRYIVPPHGLIFPDKFYNQLPNGLFDGNVCEENRVFPTGFFDLWGVDQNGDLWVFELKEKTNRSAGILSELFFYANFAQQVFQSSTCNKKHTRYRGYQKLINAAENGIKIIHACFLAPEFHTEISEEKEKITADLNKMQTNIVYHFLTYNQSKVYQHKNDPNMTHKASCS